MTAVRVQDSVSLPKVRSTAGASSYRGVPPGCWLHGDVCPTRSSDGGCCLCSAGYTLQFATTHYTTTPLFVLLPPLQARFAGKFTHFVSCLQLRVGRTHALYLHNAFAAGNAPLRLRLFVTIHIPRPRSTVSPLTVHVRATIWLFTGVTRLYATHHTRFLPLRLLHSLVHPTVLPTAPALVASPTQFGLPFAFTRFPGPYAWLLRFPHTCHTTLRLSPFWLPRYSTAAFASPRSRSAFWSAPHTVVGSWTAVHRARTPRTCLFTHHGSFCRTAHFRLQRSLQF